MKINLVGKLFATTKTLTCKHDFIYDTKIKIMHFPKKIYGVCRKCGKQSVIPYFEYLNNKG